MITIAFAVFQGVEELDLVGPWEVLSTWSHVWPDDDVSVFTMGVGPGLIRCAKGLQILPDHSHANAPPFDVLIYPGGDGTDLQLGDESVRGGDQRFSPGQLVIVDEASLAGTQTLDRIVGHAAEVGAKVLLVGDWAHLGAVEAGGAFGMLVRRRTDAPELHDVHRFHHDWERAASLQLRVGNHSAIQTYQANGRIHEGDADTMLDEVYRAWTTDLHAGRSSVMIAQRSDTVRALNNRSRADRIRSGQTTAHGPVGLHDGTVASEGDLIVSRRNNRALRVGRGWVKNGDRWQVTATHQDGSMTVRSVRQGGASVHLPADYVAKHVELGYAITAHRAQGATVDTAHTVVDASVARETLYVAMTRGREANTAYVTTDQPDAEAHLRSDGGQLAGRHVLQSALTNVGAEVSAHEALRTQHDRASSIAQLAAEYETIATAAQHQRWAALIRRSGLTPGQANAVITSDAFGALAAQLRQAEATHHDPERLLPRLIAPDHWTTQTTQPRSFTTDS